MLYGLFCVSSYHNHDIWLNHTYIRKYTHSRAITYQNMRVVVCPRTHTHKRPRVYITFTVRLPHTRTHQMSNISARALITCAFRVKCLQTRWHTPIHSYNMPYVYVFCVAMNTIETSFLDRCAPLITTQQPSVFRCSPFAHGAAHSAHDEWWVENPVSYI